MKPDETDETDETDVLDVLDVLEWVAAADAHGIPGTGAEQAPLTTPATTTRATLAATRTDPARGPRTPASLHDGSRATPRISGVDTPAAVFGNPRGAYPT